MRPGNRTERFRMDENLVKAIMMAYNKGEKGSEKAVRDSR